MPLLPVRLKCEYAVNPLGIDSARPGLSWQFESPERGQRQTAYHILIASGAEKLAAEKGDFWDSGRVDSSQSIHVVYGGKDLQSGMRAYWKVRIWDKTGKPSVCSEPAWWEMGMLKENDWHGSWIARTSDTGSNPAPLLRREFRLAKKITRARVYICGLGYYELYLNGKKVGDRVLDPAFTRYDKRILYSTYDVLDYLKSGTNAIGVMLGNGWYNVHTRNVWDFDAAPWRNSPRMLLEMRIQFEDNSNLVINSGRDWKTSAGPIIYDSIYGGEIYDAGQEKTGWACAGYQDAGWQNAKVVAAPGGTLSSAMQMPPIKVTETVKPVKITEPKPGVFVYDMGQNFAGWVRLSASGPAGTRITMQFGERLNENGTVSQTHIAQYIKKPDPFQQFQTDVYIMKGEGTEEWEPRFTYHGFQYVQVTGFPGKPTLDTLLGRVVHTAVEQVGRFECSNELVNQIWRNTLWSYTGNLHGYPTDCPHREKNGWTGDAHLAAEFGMYNFDVAGVYTKWLGDFKDEQQDDGALPGIIPTAGWGYQWGHGPAWGSACILIPWYMYLYYGDANLLEKHYENMKRYVDYLSSRAKNHLVDFGLGDWLPASEETPVALTSTGYYYCDAKLLSQIAALLGKPEDAASYGGLAEKIRKAFNDAFFNEENGGYSGNTQTALSCAFYHNIVESRHRGKVQENLLANIKKNQGHIVSGILGAKYLMDTLAKLDKVDVAYEIVTQPTYPGWGYWISMGATTLWETWEGDFSRNHVMFGDVSAWFSKVLAGINIDAEKPGFENMVIRPKPAGDLKFVRAEYNSIRGKIVSEWKVENGRFFLNITVPPNTTATVHVPSRYSENIVIDKPAGNVLLADHADGVEFLGMVENCAAYAVSSGGYAFAEKGVEKEEIKEGLRRMGLKTGDIVMLHSSLNSLGYVVGGADTVVDAFLEVLGEGGTLLVPTLTGSAEFSVENPPVFDPQKTPGWTGRIPETVRKRPGAVRSLHPTHSVAAIGARAGFLTQQHEDCQTPCGEGSPYLKLAESGGYVLFLGVTIDYCTLLHGVEELAGVPYVLQPSPVPARIVGPGRKQRTVSVKIHAYGTPRNFPRLEPELLAGGIMSKGAIGKATVRLVKAKGLVSVALQKLRENPDFLLKDR